MSLKLMQLKIRCFVISSFFLKSLTGLEYYGLDSCRYVSSPGLSWDATLKTTKIK